jgi:Ca2+/Na+ antiporter
MKPVSAITRVLGALLALAFVLDASGLTGWTRLGGSFFLGSLFAVGFLLGSAALLRFALVRRPFRRLWAGVSLLLLYVAFFVVSAVVVSEESYRPSLLFLLCLVAAYRILRAELPRTGEAREAGARESAPSPTDVGGTVSAEPGAAQAAAFGAVPRPENVAPPSPHAVAGREFWPAMVLALLVVAALLYEALLPLAQFGISHFGILLGGLAAGAGAGRGLAGRGLPARLGAHSRALPGAALRRGAARPRRHFPFVTGLPASDQPL